MRSLLSICILFFLVFPASEAQQIKVDDLKEMKIRNLGPAGMSGRVTTIDVNLSDPDHIIIGSASGGVWESLNGGITWKPIFDDIPAMSIGAVAFNQQNPSEIWVGTGEGNPRNSQNSGAGVYRSINGGKKWEFMGLKETRVIHRLYIHPQDSKTIYVGAQGSAWGPSKDRGVYKTTDGGKTWKKTLYINDKTGIADLVIDPKNPNKLVAAMWEFGRTPWDFVSGGKGSGLHISYDGGESWTQKTDEDGLPKGDLGRIGLAIAPSKPNIIYALVEAKENGLYVSKDGGEKWTLVSKKNIGNRPFYYADLYVDPQNENRIFNLWSYVSKSEDGGKSFTTIMDYGNNVHPDHHAFWIHPDNPDYMINGNDGGLNISRDGGQNWRFVSNLPLGQFYHVNIDNDFPYHVYGGMQDNGSWIGPAYVLKPGGIRNYDWQELYFGDGFDVVPYPKDSRYGFAMSQGGNVGRYDRLSGRTMIVKPVHPEGITLRFNWNAPIAQDPFNDCGVYFGSQFVHYSSDCGKSWKILSPDLTTNDSTKQKQLESGGLTIDATQAENHTTLLSISPSPVDKNVIWVGSDDGNLQLTTDGGKTWNNLIDRLKGLPKGSWIPQIEVSKSKAGEAFVVANNYRRNDWTPYLYHTTDFGKSWSRLVNEKNIGGFTLTVVQDKEEPNLLFLGTDVGLYFSIDKGQTWNKWKEGFPAVQVSDLKIHPREADLVISTFGRAIWILDNIRPLRAIARTKGEILKRDFAVFETPPAYLASFKSYEGIRFSAQAEYKGDNKYPGAVVTYWMKPKPKKETTDTKKEKSKDRSKKTDKKDADKTSDNGDKKDKKKDTKFNVWVTDVLGDTIRSFKVKPKEGLNRFNWGMNMKGVYYPSRSANKKERKKEEAGGPRVPPGKYKISIKYNELADSTMVTVSADPRYDVNANDSETKLKTQKAYMATIKKATKGMDRLIAANKSIELIGKLVHTLPDSTSKEITKLNTSVSGKIDSLMSIYSLPSGLKGIQRDPGKLRNLIGRASWYLGSSWDKPTPNSLLLLAQVEKEVDKTLEQIDAFFEDDWNAYQEKVKQLKFDLFKE